METVFSVSVRRSQKLWEFFFFCSDAKFLKHWGFRKRIWIRCKLHSKSTFLDFSTRLFKFLHNWLRTISISTSYRKKKPVVRKLFSRYMLPVLCVIQLKKNQSKRNSYNIVLKICLNCYLRCRYLRIIIRRHAVYSQL